MPKKRKTESAGLKEATKVEAAIGKRKPSNPLRESVLKFLDGVSQEEKEGFFDENVVEPERRAAIWTNQAEVGEQCVDKHSWAIPDERAMNVLKHFSPIVEVGCGANAYWCQMMLDHGIDVRGYDISVAKGGVISSKKGKSSFKVRPGGPDVLSKPENSGRNLFLCYPDELEATPTTEGDNERDDETQFSLGAECLEHYEGDYVVHVGELYGSTLSLDQAPWGRSSAAEFQQRLASEYHCILEISILNWIHVRDTLTVWKRSPTSVIVFGAEDENDHDEEVEYRHIPINEQLPIDRAAPCMRHLLPKNDTAERPRHENRNRKKKRKPEAPKQEETRQEQYECPW